MSTRLPTYLERAPVHVFHDEAELVLVLVRIVEGDDEGAVLCAYCASIDRSIVC